MPWSFSALTSYETCPKKYYHQSIARDYKDQPSTATDYGKYVHQKFEDRLINGKPLPVDLRHHEKVMCKLADAKGEGMPEQKIALNRQFECTGYFDNDVWVRGIIDYAKVNGKHLLVIDHKTGKIKDDFDQVSLMVAMMMNVLPEIETATGGYYWTKEKRITKTEVITRDDLPDIWNNFLPRVNRMEEAIKMTEFPARPNGLCKRFCPVKSCPHNGT